MSAPKSRNARSKNPCWNESAATIYATHDPSPAIESYLVYSSSVGLKPSGMLNTLNTFFCAFHFLR